MNGVQILAFSYLSAAVVLVLVMILKRCLPPLEVTYEVTSEDAKVADVNYWDVTDVHFYWLEPEQKLVHRKRVKLPFRKTVKFTSDEWSTSVAASVGAGTSVKCAVYLEGKLMVKEESSFSCIVNAHHRWDN